MLLTLVGTQGVRQAQSQDVGVSLVPGSATIPRHRLELPAEMLSGQRRTVSEADGPSLPTVACMTASARMHWKSGFVRPGFSIDCAVRLLRTRRKGGL